MIEKVNPCHPDKVADRIAGAIVDLGYAKSNNPKMAVEVLMGHGVCHIIAETSVDFIEEEVEAIVHRLTTPSMKCNLTLVKQDVHLASNQEDGIRCGDNGIFKGMPITEEQKELSKIAREIYATFPTDGKYILSDQSLIVCQSCATNKAIEELLHSYDYQLTINPLGEWTGGPDVDAGCTNRKLGSDMADGVTGGGLHGKDLSKADVSVNIYAFLLAQQLQRPVSFCCAIGDATIDGRPYSEVVEIARNFISNLGGFEKFAEWGLF